MRRTFIDRPANGLSPLVSLLHPPGGRGGRTRLALELSLLWVLAGEGHTSDRPARVWAELIGLANPSGTGARTIASALNDLERRQLIRRTTSSRAGAPRQVQLLDDGGSGDDYTIPDPKLNQYYFRVPETLWTEGLLADLSAAGIVAYLAMLSVYRPEIPGMPIFFPPARWRQRFGLSESLRRLGFRDLLRTRVAQISRAAVDPRGETDSRTRSRNIYTLHETYAPRITTSDAAQGGKDQNTLGEATSVERSPF